MVMEPVGAERGEAGGYELPLTVETTSVVILALFASMPFVEIELVDKELIAALSMLPLIVLKLKVPIMFAVIVPVLRKLVLRYPVLIGSKELLIMPPFAILMPPFILIVDAFRVEGMPPPPPGEYEEPLMVLRLMLSVLMLDVMTEP